MSAMQSKTGFTSFSERSQSRAASPSSAVFRPFRSGRSSPRPAPSSYLAKDQFDPDVPSEPLSCVTRETYQEDCARHRFVVWAAVKRNASTRMKPEDKLCCPLLRCNQHLPDHESMLRHLVGCEHLASGEYWCFDHARVERFDDMKCKRCLGHPSKRRKVLSLAKSFFHSLGHKSKQDRGLESYSEDVSFLPPPSYDSIRTTAQLPDLNELPANPIHEADSTEIPPHCAPADVTAINPQELLNPSVPELDCQPLQSFIQWDHTQTVNGFNIPWHASDDIEMYNTLTRPFLQLNTSDLPGSRQQAPPKQVLPASRSKNLSPSSSLRSNTSTNTTLSTATSLISPLSNWSGGGSLGSGFNTGLTSPVDDLWADNPFTASKNGYNDMPSDFSYLHNFYSELPGVPDTKGTGDVSSDPLLLFCDGVPSINPPYAGDITFDEEGIQDLALGDSDVGAFEVCCSETKSLVVSASDALQAHIDESTLKIQQVAVTQLAEQLRSMSIKAVAMAGLRTLRALLSGSSPSSALDALCFIHLTYAFSMVTFEQHTVELSTNLFAQSLSYGAEIPPVDRNVYQQLVSLIWQPPDASPELRRTLSRSFVAQGKQPEVHCGGKLGPDTLLCVALGFLDKLEISLILGQPPISPEEQVSDLYATHLVNNNPAIMQTPFPFAAKQSIHILVLDYANAAGVAENLMKVARRVDGGMLLSVRKLELELMQAGMGCMDTLRYYGSFIPDVRKLCDQMYENHNSASSRRTAYHDHAVSLVENLMSLSEQHAGVPLILDEVDDFEKFFNQVTSCYGQSQPTPASSLDPLTTMASPDPAMGISGTQSIENHDIQVPTVTTTPPDTLGNEPLSVTPEAHPRPEPPAQVQQQLTEEQKQKLIDADAYCECGYVPKGDPKWFRGSMAKHRKLKHSTAPPTIYKCPVPGCSSAFRNRPDNLRQHQIEKGHFIQGEAIVPKRPSKRKKTALEEE